MIMVLRATRVHLVVKPLLGPLLGHVTRDAACAWIRLPRNAPLHLLEIESRPLHAPAWGTDGVRVAEMPPIRGGDGTAVGRVPLAGGADVVHRLVVRFRREGLRPAAPLGELFARSAPADAPTGRVAFAFGSCWRVDAVGDVGATWRVLDVLARARHVDHALLLGDQVYADVTPLPTSTARRTATQRALRVPPAGPHERRIAAYREAYQRAWEDPDLAAPLSRLPVVSIWDDHEIANGWGSETFHREDRWKRVFDAAATAYDEFQGCRNPPPLAEGLRAHAFRRGPAAFLTLDLRTRRDIVSGIVLGAEQREAIAAWLRGDDAQGARVLVVAASVPLFHLPQLLQQVRGPSDVRDQWSYGANALERAWLLRELLEWESADPARTLVMLGGDVHLATAVRVAGAGRTRWLLTSSPLANRLPSYLYPALTLLGRRFRVGVEGRTDKLAAHVVHRWRGPNVGVVTGEVTEHGTRLAFELFRPGRRTEIVPLD